MKLRYILYIYLSISFIFISFNLYKGKSLDEKILIHDSGNNWYVMSLLEQDSREDIKLGDNLYEKYHGIYFLTKKSSHDYFTILYPMKQTDISFVSELKGNTIDMLCELPPSRYADEKIFYHGQYLYVIHEEKVFVFDINTKDIVKIFYDRKPNSVVSKRKDGIALINKNNELIYMDSNKDYCISPFDKDDEFCGMCSDDTLLVYNKKGKTSKIMNLENQTIYSLGSHIYEVLDYHNGKVLMTMYPKSSSAGGFLDIEIQTICGVPYTITYSHTPFILDMTTKSICSLNISTWNYKDHHFITD